MINLEALATVERHPLFSVLKPYPKIKLAQVLGCNPSFLNNVLLGHAKASKEMEAKIAALAADIVVAEKAQTLTRRVKA